MIWRSYLSLLLLITSLGVRPTAVLQETREPFRIQRQSAQTDRDVLASESVGLGKSATVLIVLAPDCKVCLDSIPFYKRLLALSRMDGVDRRLVVLAQKGVIPVKRMLDSQKFQPHLVTSGPAATHDIADLPTVIVLDSKGVRQGAWTGQLTPAQEQAVMSTIARQTPPRI